MKKVFAASLALIFATVATRAAERPAGAVSKYKLSEKSRPLYQITVDRDASAPERFAASELADHLAKITGGSFKVGEPGRDPSLPVIAVGPGAAAHVMPGLPMDLASMRHDGVLLTGDGKNLVLTGARGARRGTVYAVFTFLEDFCGVRWWTDSFSTIPANPDLEVELGELRHTPPFEFREIFSQGAFDPEWKVRNKCNGSNVWAAGKASKMFDGIPASSGGAIVFTEGFTNNALSFVEPADKTFARHPDWFPEIGGKRVLRGRDSQLCFSSAGLAARVIEKAEETLKNAGNAETIISISRGGGGDSCRCQCPDCAKIEREEGSVLGPFVRFVNAVAESLARDFPDARVETLAHPVSADRKTPKTRPAKNVIVRITDIECSFSSPLNGPQNTAFAAALDKCAAYSGDIYIWDYATNFSMSAYPFPNLNVLDKNLRFLASKNVRGVFEHGAFETKGGELAELRNWVLAKLLWNPSLDCWTLVREFCLNYYGRAAPHVIEYLEALHSQLEYNNHFLSSCDPPQPTFYLNPEFLAKSDRILRKAEAAVAANSEFTSRVQAVRLPILFATLVTWPRFSQYAAASGKPLKWEFQPSIETMFKEFSMLGDKLGVTKLGEPDAYPPPGAWPESFPIVRREAPPPHEFPKLKRTEWYDIQDNAMEMKRTGRSVSMVRDSLASDGYALEVSSDTPGIAVQAVLPEDIPPGGTWSVYAAVRVKKYYFSSNNNSTAFKAGIYDCGEKKSLAFVSVGHDTMKNPGAYELHKIGTCVLKKPGSWRYENSIRIWFAAPNLPGNSDSLFLDRIILVRH